MKPHILFSVLIFSIISCNNSSNQASDIKTNLTGNSIKISSMQSKTSVDDIVKQIDERVKQFEVTANDNRVETEHIIISSDFDRESGLKLEKSILTFCINNEPKLIVVTDISRGEGYNENYDVRYYLNSKKDCYMIENHYELTDGAEYRYKSLKVYYNEEKTIYCKSTTGNMNPEGFDGENVTVLDLTKMNSVNTREFKEINEGIDLIKEKISDIDLGVNKLK